MHLGRVRHHDLGGHRLPDIVHDHIGEHRLHNLFDGLLVARLGCVVHHCLGELGLRSRSLVAGGLCLVRLRRGLGPCVDQPEPRREVERDDLGGRLLGVGRIDLRAVQDLGVIRDPRQVVHGRLRLLARGLLGRLLLPEGGHLLGERPRELELADHALCHERFSEALTGLALPFERLVELLLGDEPALDEDLP